MCFNRDFAQELLADIARDVEHHYTDNVVANVTMRKFRCHVSSRNTSVHHAHDGAVSSRGDSLARAFS